MVRAFQGCRQTLPPNATTSSPPPYKSLAPSLLEAAAIEAFWDEMRPTGKAWNENPNLIFKFTPKILQTWSLRRILRNREEQPEWHATLSVWAKNILRLMRCGFHWSPLDIMKEQGCIYPRGEPGCDKVAHKRFYVFHNANKNQDWTAQLCVLSRKASTVANFDLNWITMNTVTEAQAWNYHKHKVYEAPFGSKPGFNAIYDQMPMEGWWPWPKPPVKEEAEEEGRTTSEEWNGFSD